MIVSGSTEDAVIKSMLSRSDATELSMAVEWKSKELKQQTLVEVPVPLCLSLLLHCFASFCCYVSLCLCL